MITIENLSKAFKVYPKRSDRLKEWLTFGQKSYHQDYWALRNINLKMDEGEVFGLIGMNGAGKSTLLKILTGTMFPTLGQFQMKGRVAALLELGTGFHGELTGRDNVRLNGRLLGLTDQEIDSKMDIIKDFCELGDFFDKPVRTYSSGMYVRLAFSLASSIEPDVLIIDEALSVGDAYFQQKCLRRIERFKEEGTTILFVSHDPGAIKLLCDRVGLLNRGQLLAEGDAQDMLEEYNALLAKVDGHGCQYSIDRSHEISNEATLVAGNRRAEIKQVQLVNEQGRSITAIVTGQKVKLVVEAQFNSDIQNPTVGILIRDRLGYDIFGTNTAEMHIPTDSFRDRDQVRFSFEFEMNIGPGDYTITVAMHSSKTHVEECYQWVDRILTFKVLPRPDFQFLGVSYLRPQFAIDRL
ncbi:MAG: ABC transporter ATP-binding protein [Oligoflexus sp.]